MICGAPGCALGRRVRTILVIARKEVMTPLILATWHRD